MSERHQSGSSKKGIGGAVKRFKTAFTAQDYARWRRFALFGLSLLLITCTEEKTIVNPAPPSGDHIAPEIVWLSPQSNSELSGDVSLTFTVADSSGIQRISLFRNGSSPADWQVTPHTDSLYTLTWNTTTVEDGLYILEVRAWDNSGNLGISPSLLVRVKNTPTPPPEDRTPPQLAWLSPNAGSTLSDSVMLMLMVSDDVGVDSVQLLKDGAIVDLPPLRSRGGVRGGQGRVTAQTDTTLTYLWDTTSDSDGVHIWEARAWDTSSNTGVSAGLLVKVKNRADVTPDTQPPVVMWVAPEAGSVVRGSVALRFQAIDDNEVDAIKVYLNGALAFEMAGHEALDYEVEWNTEEREDGLYSIDLQAQDASGNTGVSAGLVVTVANHPPDTTPPDVWWESPDGGATLRDTVMLRVWVYDESGVDSVHLLKDGALVASLPPRLRGGARGGEYEATYLWNTLADSDGVHIWEAVAWDKSGGVGVSPALLVRVDNNQLPPEGDRTPPVIAWLSPEPGDTLEGTVDLRFNVLDDDRVDSVKVYVVGASSKTYKYNFPEYSNYVTWVTSEGSDGNYLVEVRAWDRSGNMGLSDILTFQVWNNRPRVIWVPDDFERIQDAIWDCSEHDTIRVRPGTYDEHWITFGTKNLWLESSDGPEATVIDADSVGGGIGISGEQDTSTCIRGFTIKNSLGPGIYVGGAFTGLRIINNITISNVISGIRVSSQNHCIIRNNIFADAREGVELFISYGVFENNVVIHSERYALWNISAWNINPLIPDYNLIWDYGNLMDPDPGFNLGPHNILDSDPLFLGDGFQLQDDSPCINAGNPDIIDRDGSISDIGVYGGPLSYPPPQ